MGKPLIEFDSLDSTNDFAANLISKSNPTEGTVVLAHFQTAGKGQIGRKWESEPNLNLLMSIILKPNFLKIDHHFHLNIISSLAIARAIETIIPQKISVKWPNDVYCKTNKICGILIQNVLQGQQIQSTIIGIGLNVNQIHFDADLPNPSSLRIETGRIQDVAKIRNLIFYFLEQYYLEIKSGNLAPLIQDYQSRIFQKDIPSIYQNASGFVFEGTIQGIDSHGRLIIEVDGQNEYFSINEIKYLPNKR